ncbi:hypothetical protein HK097_007809 [Rhizophlyctis rosea]|uniref:Phosphoglycerate mutase-like protein n=1 Tax=Rhizophlyctis rosea TaxID=64517 RepID=A0AAD5X4C2_9FUNG|nr:hypothetical protein HK097_007809 [Rhizophlyctis rosea]
MPSTAALPPLPKPAKNYRYSVLPGFFAQSDPKTDEHTFPQHPARFGLMDDSDDRWKRFRARIQGLNKEARKKRLKSRVKFLLFQRHGQGEHNLAEQKYGKKLWDEYYSKQPEYFDPSLTPLGITQTTSVRNLLKTELTHSYPLPQLLVSSPLSRCLNTTFLIYSTLLSPPSQPQPSTQITLTSQHPHITPLVHELFREQYGDHTCDARRSRTDLKSLYPQFDYANLFSNSDELWKADEREPVEHVDQRVKEGLDWIWNRGEEEEFVSVVAHGGIVEGMFRVTGHREFEVVPGGFLPMVVRGEWD